MSRHAWTSEQIASLVQAVNKAPSVHNTQPWDLSARGREATLSLREDVSLERHDPEHRDLLISFGAALANLILAVRRTGWSADVKFSGDAEGQGCVAVVTATRRAEPNAAEIRRYNAIPRRSTYRRDFSDVPVAHLQREAVLSAATAPGIRPMWVIGPEMALDLAQRLGYASRVFRADSAYQRELSAWTFPEDYPTGPIEEAGMPANALAERGMAAMGLARPGTRVLDPHTLADRIEQESVMVLTTESDERMDHIRVGEAMELAWLAATALGLAASVMTQPLHLTEVREGLRSSLGVQGAPQVVLRFGYPDAVPLPRSPRRPAPEDP